MERFSHREHLLSGYINDQSPSHIAGDVDFNDVFGGPPRRSSMHEMRHGLIVTGDSYGDGGTRRAWSGLGEKPVFGAEVLNRRRYQSDDFFGDIFRGDESQSSTPSKLDRGSFSSPPGLGVPSPARTVVEPFGSCSLPAQFSLPAKLSKVMDLPTFGSTPCSPSKLKDVASNGTRVSYSSNVSPSRFLSETTGILEEAKNDLDLSHQTPSSQNILLTSGEASNSIKVNETDTVGNLSKDPGTEVPTDGSQFHFSIYKWASKGVPFSMPRRVGSKSRLKHMDSSQSFRRSDETLACDNMTRVLPTNTPTDIDVPSKDHVSENTPTDIDIPDGSLENKSESHQIVEKALVPLSHSEQMSVLQTIEKNVTIKTIFPHSEDKRNVKDTGGSEGKVDRESFLLIKEPKETESRSVRSLFYGGTGFGVKIKKETPMVIQDAQMPESRSVPSLSYCNQDETGKNEKIRMYGIKETAKRSTRKPSVDVNLQKKINKQEGQQTAFAKMEANTVGLQSAPVSSGKKFGSSRFKGKVDEFVKIFNQEVSPKPTTDGYSRNRSSRRKDNDVPRPEKEVNIGTNVNNEKMQPVVNNNKTVPDVMVNNDVNMPEKQHSASKTSIKLPSDNSSGQKFNLPASSASMQDRSSSIAGDNDDSFQQEFMIKELSEDDDKQMQPGKDSEELQAADAKIRKWSNGKGGNIRSLLSTLQFVLWAESGWRPVPLVDIIEGNSVKRAYQRALLCLHPDKLQQKGAASHQKYIAEKVFDILQEAWGHFNSMGSVNLM